MSICYSCFKEHSDYVKICPHCGKEKMVTAAEPVYLIPGTVLLDRYIIGESIGAGGFGVVYKAWDTKLETIVAVKEFFANRLVTRAEGLKNVIISKKSVDEFNYRKERFLAEARNMAMLRSHKNIPNVFEYFEENNTAYIVMELLNGLTLRDYMQQSDEAISVEFAVMIANEVGQALKSLHERNIIHRDVAPDNIYICNGREIKIKLMDLGAAKLADSTDDVIDVITKPGYSPVEQYDNSNNFGPWSDIYALGATLYMMLTGVKPDESTNRKEQDTVVPVNELNPMVSENLSNTIMKAIAIEKHMRFKTMDEFLKALNGEKKVVSLLKEKKRRNYKRFIGIAVAILILLIGGNWVIEDYNYKKLTEDIEVWIRLSEGDSESTEREKWEVIANAFTDSPLQDINIEFEFFYEEDYDKKIEDALENDTAPDLFVSTYLGDEYKSKLEPTYGGYCEEWLYIDGQYGDIYPAGEKTPLAIEIPVAVVKSTVYAEDYYSEITDFNGNVVSCDERCSSFIWANFEIGHSDGMLGTEDFINGTADVIITTTMYMDEIMKKCAQKGDGTKAVYMSGDYIWCGPQYEMSVKSYGEYSKNSYEKNKSAERFLSYLLCGDSQKILFSQGKYRPMNEFSEIKNGELIKTFECKELQYVNEVYLFKDGVEQ